MAKTFNYQGVAITWFGHSSFLLEHEKEAVYIDNYALPESVERKATIIIHTHGHYDHCAPSEKIAENKTVYAGMCKHARDLIGNTLRIRDVKIEFVEAYNISKPFHPRGAGCGVVVTLGGVRIYHAGDTDFIPEMASIRCDVALLPIGGTFTMNEKEAADAVKAINPAVAIPMHYDYIPQTKADAGYFKKLVESNFSNTKIVILG
ncbi:Beta-lactamase superfamily domain protein [uncultured archaeon]|nr:Beta-lactamase superfamily domain protein [uncultured archaeon]